MPIYEYRCNECGYEFEEYRGMADRYNVNCPDCKRAVHIRMSVFVEGRPSHTFTTYGHDGQIIGQRQTTERTSLKVRKHSGKLVNL